MRVALKRGLNWPESFILVVDRITTSAEDYIQQHGWPPDNSFCCSKMHVLNHTLICIFRTARGFPVTMTNSMWWTAFFWTGGSGQIFRGTVNATTEICDELQYLHRHVPSPRIGFSEPSLYSVCGCLFKYFFFFWLLLFSGDKQRRPALHTVVPNSEFGIGAQSQSPTADQFTSWDMDNNCNIAIPPLKEEYPVDAGDNNNCNTNNNSQGEWFTLILFVVEILLLCIVVS